MIDEVKKSRFGAQAGGDTNHYISTISITLVSPWVRTRSTGQYCNVPVLRYRTLFEYTDVTQLMNDKCTGWIGRPSYPSGHCPKFNSCFSSVSMARSAKLEFIYTWSYFPRTRGFPQRYAMQRTTWQGWIHRLLLHKAYSLSFIFGFLKNKYFNILSLISRLPPTFPQSNKSTSRWVWGFGLC